VLALPNGIDTEFFDPAATDANPYAGQSGPHIVFMDYPPNIAAAERLDVWTKKKGLAGAAEAALAWVLSRPQVSSAIIGATKLEQLEANVKAAEVKLSAADGKEAEAVVRGRPARAAKRPARGKAKRKAKRAR